MKHPLLCLLMVFTLVFAPLLHEAAESAISGHHNTASTLTDSVDTATAGDAVSAPAEHDSAFAMDHDCCCAPMHSAILSVVAEPPSLAGMVAFHSTHSAMRSFISGPPLEPPASA